jgi:hypothetical protein
MKKRRKKSREPGLFEMQVIEIQRRSVRRGVVELICDGDSASLAVRNVKKLLGDEKMALTEITTSIIGTGLSLRTTRKGWRILHCRRVIFSGKTYEAFLAEFFPDAAPTAPSTQTLNIKTP